MDYPSCKKDDKMSNKSRVRQHESELLVCHLCAKRYTNKKTLSRHMSYCRKTIGRLHSRKRACQSCTKAKARCDASLPRCSRCFGRNIQCEYAQELYSERQSRSKDLQVGFGISKHSTGVSSSNHLRGEAKLNSGIYGTWDQHSCHSDSLCSDGNTPSRVIHDTNTLQPQSDGTELILRESVYCSTLFPRPLRVFVTRGNSTTRSPLTQRYLWSTLRSYPMMMLRGHDPPFIHPYAMLDDPEIPDPTQLVKPGPLAICYELLQMLMLKNGDNVIQIWRAIRKEQERLLGEYRGYDFRTTLAALQAISIYFILRIFEQNEEATDFDVPLVQTMLELAIHLSKLDKARPLQLFFNWQDWILNESKNRTFLFLCLLPCFLDIYPAVMLFHQCTGDQLLKCLLPSGRLLWRADSNAKFLTEYERHCRRVESQDSRPKATYADLLQYNVQSDSSLDYWLSEMDEFGNLVMATASIQN